MSEQGVSPHVFHTADAEDYPGVSAVSAKLSFPNPVTFGDYKRWYRAITPTPDDEGMDSFLREYRAAMTIASLEETIPEEDVTPNPHGSDTFNLRDVVLVDGQVPDTLPISFANWVCDCAEECFGVDVVLEGRQAKINRLSHFRLQSPAFHTADEPITRLLPNIRRYDGHVSFVRTMTKTHYLKWQRALEPKKGISPLDVDNSLLARQYRAALEIIEEWEIDGVPFKQAKAKDGEYVPLVVVSFVVLAAEMYLSKTMPLKKMPALSAGL